MTAERESDLFNHEGPVIIYRGGGGGAGANKGQVTIFYAGPQEKMQMYKPIKC